MHSTTLSLRGSYPLRPQFPLFVVVVSSRETSTSDLQTLIGMSITTLSRELIALIILKGCENQLHSTRRFDESENHPRRLKDFARWARMVCKTWRDIVDDSHPNSNRFWLATAIMSTDTQPVAKSLKEFQNIISNSNGSDLTIAFIYESDEQFDTTSNGARPDYVYNVDRSAKARLFLHGMNLLWKYQDQIWGISFCSNNLQMTRYFPSFVAGLSSKRLEEICWEETMEDPEPRQIWDSKDIPNWVDRDNILISSRHKVTLPLSPEFLPRLKDLEVIDSPWFYELNLSATTLQRLAIDSRWIVYLIKSLDIQYGLRVNLEALSITGDYLGRERAIRSLLGGI